MDKPMKIYIADHIRLKQTEKVAEHNRLKAGLYCSKGHYPYPHLFTGQTNTQG